jgi:hypothetical protein
MDLFRTVRLLQIVVLGGLALFGGLYLFRLLRFGGGLGAQFGAAVRSFVGRVSPSAYRLLPARIDVHTLDPLDATAGPHVGLRVRLFRRRPAFVPLSRTEARALADLLARSAQDSEREQPAASGAPGLLRQGWLHPMFGAAVRASAGVIAPRMNALVKTSVEIDTLDPVNTIAGPHVGLRVVTRLLAAPSNVPLTRSEARALADLLVTSARE